MTYSYDPTKIRERGKDQMRFELGDTVTEGGADTCSVPSVSCFGLGISAEMILPIRIRLFTLFGSIASGGMISPIL